MWQLSAKGSGVEFLRYSLTATSSQLTQSTVGFHLDGRGSNLGIPLGRGPCEAALGRPLPLG